MSRIWDKNLYQIDAYLNEMPDVISFKDKNLEDFKHIILGFLFYQYDYPVENVSWPINVILNIGSKKLFMEPIGLSKEAKLLASIPEQDLKNMFAYFEPKFEDKEDPTNSIENYIVENFYKPSSHELMDIYYKFMKFTERYS